MKRTTKVVLQTSLREIMSNLYSYARDVYLPNPKRPDDRPELEFGDIFQYFTALQNPRMLKKALADGDVCPAIYFDLGEIEQCTNDHQKFVVQILDDSGFLWLELNEVELGQW